MEPKNFCQSCAMPIDAPGLAGTEADGSASQDYCKYCYQSGQFTDPNIGLEEMKTKIRGIMEAQYMSNDTVNRTLALLPQLKRWRQQR